MILHPADLREMRCDWCQDFGNHHPDSATTAIVSVSGLVMSNENGSKGDFSVSIKNLEENSTFCVQVELVDHPYCSSHLTIGHQLHQPIVCVNHVAQPLTIPKCQDGPIIMDYGVHSRMIIGVLAGVLGILATAAIFAVFYRFRSKKRVGNRRGKPSKAHLNETPIIKSGAIISNSQANSCTNTLLSKINMMIPDIFLLYFPDTKHFEDINIIFRDWLASLGNRVYDLSDSKYDEEISKDPESWVMKILMNPNIRILVLDSPVARFSLALASSSTATTSLVSSTASVDSEEHNVEDMHNVEEMNSQEIEAEDEEAAIRVPLSQEPLGSENNLECGDSAMGNVPLPECAIEDNRYELRVFGMKMIQSRFIGKYKQVIVLRYENGIPGDQTKTQPRHLLPPSQNNKDASASSRQNSQIPDGGAGKTGNVVFHPQDIAKTLTPHKQCLVLPQQMPELRSWLRGQGDLYCGNECLSDFIEADTGTMSPSMAEELPSEEYHNMNGNHILPQFHRHRLTSTSSSQASTASHPSSPLLSSSALEIKLRSSLSTSSSSSNSSSLSSTNRNKTFLIGKKSTKSGTTTSIA